MRLFTGWKRPAGSPPNDGDENKRRARVYRLTVREETTSR